MMHINLKTSAPELADKVTDAAIQNLRNNPESLIKPEDSPEKKSIAMLYARGFISDRKLERVLNYTILKLGLDYYKRFVNQPIHPDFPKFIRALECIAYTMQNGNGMLNQKDLEKFYYIGGITPANFCKIYDDKDLVGELKQELVELAKKTTNAVDEQEEEILRQLEVDEFMRKENPL